MCVQTSIFGDGDKTMGMLLSERQHALAAPLMVADQPRPFARHVLETVARLDQSPAGLDDRGDAVASIIGNTGGIALIDERGLTGRQAAFGA